MLKRMKLALWILLALVMMFLTFPVLAAPATWPDTSIWPNTSSSNAYAYKMLVSGTPTPVRDINGDENPDSVDVSSHGNRTAVGDWNSVYFYATGTHLFFRELVNDNPGTGSTWVQYSWLVEIDVNGDGVSDWRVGIAGVDEQVYATCFTTSTSTTRSADPANGYTRQINTGVIGPSTNPAKTMYYADWQIELSALNDGAGGCADINPSTPIRLFFGTSSNGQVGGTINKDFFSGASVNYTNMVYVSSNSPLAVTIASFTADAQPDGILLAWETVSEQNNAGFNLYRAEFEAGPWALLNPQLIPSAVPGATGGQTYSWLDRTASLQAAAWYRLEAIDLQGNTEALKTLTYHPQAEVGAVRLWLPLYRR